MEPWSHLTIQEKRFDTFKWNRFCSFSWNKLKWKKHLYYSLCYLSQCLWFAQKEKPLAQKLGFDSGAKLLIIHADDIGVAHSVNTASFDGFLTESITSGVMFVLGF